MLVPQGRFKLLEPEAAIIVYQLASILNFLHMKGIFHRNVNPLDVYVSTLASGCRVMLDGFHRAKQASQEHVSEHGSSGSGVKGDTWSLGVVALYLTTNSTMLDRNHLYNYSVVSKAPGDVHRIQKSGDWDDLSVGLRVFIQYLLCQHEESSMFLGQLLKHEWLAGRRNYVEGQYAKIVRHWRSSVSDIHKVEFILDRSLEVRNYSCAKAVIKEQREKEGGARSLDKPVDPPYPPYLKTCI